MFNGKLKAELLEAKLKIMRLEDKLERATDRERELLEQTQTLRTQRDMAKDRHKETIGQVHELDKKNAILMERLDLLANHLPAGQPGAFNSPEEIEDAEWALSNGRINQAEFEEILAQAGALNTEIHFDADSYPRLSAVK